MQIWRGALVVLFLFAWPLVWFLSSLSIFGFGGQCAVDNCSPEPTTIETVLFFAYLIAPPAGVIAIWVKWRLKRNKLRAAGNGT